MSKKSTTAKHRGVKLQVVLSFKNASRLNSRKAFDLIEGAIEASRDEIGITAFGITATPHVRARGMMTNDQEQE